MPPYIVNNELSHYVRLLNANIPFSMARYFDGEWNIITGRRGFPNRTGGGHLYYPQLANDLKQSVLNPHSSEQFYYGTWMNIAKPHFSRQFCLDNNIPITWYDGYIFHQALMEGKLFPLIDAMRRKEIVFIGPPSLREVEKCLFPCKHYVEIIERDCYVQKKFMIKEGIKYATKNCVIAVHASLGGKVIVYELFKHLKETCFIIDFGSIWNPFCEDSRMRGWWRKTMDNDMGKFYQLLKMNLGL